jgi:hypothetical protein
MNNKLQPALIGGLALGFLSVIPVINLGNVCCCLWVIGGGALAAHLYIKKSPTPVSLGEGAVVGVFAGIVGSVILVVIGLPLGLLFGDFTQQMLVKAYYQMSPEMGRLLEAELAKYANMSIGEKLLQLLPWQLLNVVITTAMATLGGLLGTALLEKRKPEAGAPPIPPPDFGNYR